MRAVFAGLIYVSLCLLTHGATSVTYPDSYVVEHNGAVFLFEKSDVHSTSNAPPVWTATQGSLGQRWYLFMHEFAVTWRIGSTVTPTSQDQVLYRSKANAKFPDSLGWENSSGSDVEGFKINGYTMLTGTTCEETAYVAEMEWFEDASDCHRLGKKFCVKDCIRNKYAGLDKCTYQDSFVCGDRCNVEYYCKGSVDVLDLHKDASLLPSCMEEAVSDNVGTDDPTSFDVSYPDAWSVNWGGYTSVYNIVPGVIHNSRPVWKRVNAAGENFLTYIYSAYEESGNVPQNVWRVGCSYLVAHTFAFSAPDQQRPNSGSWKDYETLATLGENESGDNEFKITAPSTATWAKIDISDLNNIVSMKSLMSWCRASRDNCISCNGNWSSWLGKCRDGKIRPFPLMRCPSFRKNAALCEYLKCTPKVTKKGKNKCKGGDKPGRVTTLKYE